MNAWRMGEQRGVYYHRLRPDIVEVRVQDDWITDTPENSWSADSAYPQRVDSELLFTERTK